MNTSEVKKYSNGLPEGSDWYEWVSYDVWGNEEDGWEVNDIFHHEDKKVVIHDDLTDKDVIRVLCAEGILNRQYIDDVDVEFLDDYYIELTEKETGKPIGRLEKVQDIESSHKLVKSAKKSIKSGRYIKSGTSNFASNRASVDFPLVAYFAENYVYDEETDSETEERDYDADSWEYEDAYDSAKELAEEMGIEISDFDIHRMRYDSRDAGYEQPFFVGIGGGYYDGLQIFIDDNLYFSPEDIANDEGLLDEFEYAEDQADYDRVVKEVEERVQNEWADKINAYLDKLCSDYGWIKLGVTARFNNGETWYSEIDNSRRPVKSDWKREAEFMNDRIRDDNLLYQVFKIEDEHNGN